MLSGGDERFDLLREIGAGGFGVVYEALDRATGDTVAVKVLSTADAIAEKRFEREAALLAELRHSSIVRYVAQGRTRTGSAYLAMEWLEGQTLEARLTEGALSVADALVCARCVIEGLTAAAGLGVVHRDIKPANLFLVANDVARVKILDFGLARRVDDSADKGLTRTGAALGTPRYMSPEQARGEAGVGTASDIFSLGSVLYECLTGSRPFETGHMIATLMMICVEEPTRLEAQRPGIPSALAALVHRMMSKQCAARPTLAAIHAELAGIESNTYEDTLADLLPATIAASPLSSSSRTSMSSQGPQRVLSAVFVGGAEHAPIEVEQKVSSVLRTFGARGERLRDGSRILMLDGHLTASEQALAAARCALAIQELLPAVSIAVCTGRAVVDRKLPLGDLIERGARLVSESPPGLVQVDEDSGALLDTRFEIRPEGILERERTSGETPRTVLGQVTPFVGRERELERITRLCRDSVEDSAARAVLVVGPAGAGKSRFRYELLQRLPAFDAALTVLTAEGDSMRSSTPFSVLAPALNRWAELSTTDSLALKQQKLMERALALLPPERAELVGHFLGEMIGVPFPDEVSPHLRAARRDPQLMADRVMSSFLAWLSSLSEQGTVVFLVEDLHWADGASVRLLDAALGALEARPFVVLAFARPEVRDLFPKLWADRDLCEIRMPKLSTKACEQLLLAIGGADLSVSSRAWLIERAEGNPFFLEELMRGMGARSDVRSGLPDTIVGMIQTRLDALGEGATLLLRAASVFGQVFKLEAAKALLGEQAARLDLVGWLRLLTDRDVIFARGEPSEREYAFRHALIRDAAYALLPDEERIVGHRLAAEWLEGHGSDDPAVLARHYERGEVLERAAHWYGLAATLALQADALSDVVECGERALACGASGESLGEVASLVAEALSYLGKWDGAATWAQTAESNLRPSTNAWWRACMVRASTFLVQGDFQGAEEVVDRMLEPCDRPLVPEQVIALTTVANNSLILVRYALGARILDRLPEKAPAELGDRVEGSMQGARFMLAFIRGDLGRALACGRETCAAYRRAGASRDVAVALNNTGFLLFELGQYEEAEWHLLEGLQLSQRLGTPGTFSGFQQNLGMLYLRTGRLEQAADAFEHSAAGLARLDMSADRALSLAFLASVSATRGEVARARDLSIRAIELSAAEPRLHAVALSLAAQIDLRAGQPVEALAAAQKAMDLVSNHDLSEYVSLIRTTHVECLLASERKAEAQKALAEAHAWLKARAAKIDDATLRSSFLTQVPEHARILELAASWLSPIALGA